MQPKNQTTNSSTDQPESAQVLISTFTVVILIVGIVCLFLAIGIVCFAWRRKICRCKSNETNNVKKVPEDSENPTIKSRYVKDPTVKTLAHTRESHGYAYVTNEQVPDIMGEIHHYENNAKQTQIELHQVPEMKGEIHHYVNNEERKEKESNQTQPRESHHYSYISNEQMPELMGKDNPNQNDKEREEIELDKTQARESHSYDNIKTKIMKQNVDTEKKNNEENTISSLTTLDVTEESTTRLQTKAITSMCENQNNNSIPLPKQRRPKNVNREHDTKVENPDYTKKVVLKPKANKQKNTKDTEEKGTYATSRDTEDTIQKVKSARTRRTENTVQKHKEAKPTHTEDAVFKYKNVKPGFTEDSAQQPIKRARLNHTGETVQNSQEAKPSCTGYTVKKSERPKRSKDENKKQKTNIAKQGNSDVAMKNIEGRNQNKMQNKFRKEKSVRHFNNPVVRNDNETKQDTTNDTVGQTEQFNIDNTHNSMNQETLEKRVQKSKGTNVNVIRESEEESCYENTIITKDVISNTMPVFVQDDMSADVVPENEYIHGISTELDDLSCHEPAYENTERNTTDTDIFNSGNLLEEPTYEVMNRNSSSSEEHNDKAEYATTTTDSLSLVEHQRNHTSANSKRDSSSSAVSSTVSTASSSSVTHKFNSEEPHASETDSPTPGSSNSLQYTLMVAGNNSIIINNASTVVFQHQ